MSCEVSYVSKFDSKHGHQTGTLHSLSYIFIRLAQLGKIIQDQYGPKICHSWHYKKYFGLKIKSKMFQIYFAHSVQRFQPFTHIYTFYAATCYWLLLYFMMVCLKYLTVFYHFCKLLLSFTNSYHFLDKLYFSFPDLSSQQRRC